MAMAAVVVIPLCNKFGKRNVCVAGMIFGGIGRSYSAATAERSDDTGGSWRGFKMPLAPLRYAI